MPVPGMRQPAPDQGPAPAGPPAGDLEAAEAQIEAVRAETAAQLEQARAETASQAVARHAAGLDAAEARAAAAQAITAMHAEAAARQHAEQQADDAGRTLDGERQ